MTESGERETLIDMKYNAADMLEEVSTIHGTKINYKYKSDNLSISHQETEFEVGSRPTIKCYENFMVMMTKHNRSFAVDIIDAKSLEIIQKLTFKRTSKIDFFNYQGRLIVMESTSSSTELKIFSYDESTNLFVESPKTLMFGRDVVISFQALFMVASENRKVSIFELEDDDWSVKDFVFQKPVKIYTNENFVAVHEDESLKLIYNDENEWKVKFLMGGFKENATNVLSRLGVDRQKHEKLLKTSNQFREQFLAYSNFILWSSISEKNGNFNKILKLLTLDENYCVQKSQTFEIARCNTIKQANDENYYVDLNDSGIYVGKDVKFSIGSWQREEISASEAIPLGENFSIQQLPNGATIFIDKTTQSVIYIQPSASFVNRFPFYIACQEENAVKVLIFDEGKKISFTKIFEGEKLMDESTFDRIFTMKSSNLSIRSIQAFLPVKTLIVEEKVTSRDEVRVRTFTRKYEKNSLTVTTVSGLSKDDFGWTEEISSGGELQKRFFDNEGKIVKAEINQINIEDVLNEDDDDGVLFDSMRSLQICDFTPYKISDDGVAFYSFEDYENAQKWNFNAINLVKKEISFTGKKI